MMHPLNATARRLALGVALACLAAPVAQARPVPAQKPGEPPVVTNNVDRPETDDEAVLALKAMNMPVTATKPDALPTAKLHVPDGFKVEPWATGLANARSMQVGDKGTVFVGSRIAGKVYAIVDKGDHREVKVIASGMRRPNGVAFHDGTLYIAEINRISKIDNVEDNLDNPGKPVTVYDDLPNDEAHGWKFIKVGPDNKLYVPIGSPGNNLMPPPTHAQIRRMDLDGKNAEVVAYGVRNSVGFDWNPKTHQMWFTDNGRDWVSEDLPNDELNVLAETGKHYGYPFCHQGNLRDPEYGWGKDCADYVPPVALLGPHTASLGMRFYTQKAFPADYQGGIFIAQHGSWNRSKKLGGQVAFVKVDKDGKVAAPYQPFLTGFVQDNELVGRPVDVQPMKDGSLLVSDDLNGAIWRVSHTQKSAEAK